MTKEVSNDILATLEMMRNSKGDNRYSWMKNTKMYSKISKCYAFSNEDLSWYYPLFDIKNNDVLTVCGSGDQVLSAILYGAKSVDIFDSNKLAYYHLMLKITAINVLNYDEFIKFYTLNDYNKDRYNYYKIIIKNISDSNIKSFWNKILFSNNDLSYCFLGCYVNPILVNSKIPYLDMNNYVLLKKRINNTEIHFENIDIFKIVDNFNKKYSFINLSNILYYISDKDAYINFIKTLSNNNLKDDGSILLNYYWDNSIPDKRNGMVYESLNANSYVSPYYNDGKNNNICNEVKVYSKLKSI